MTLFDPDAFPSRADNTAPKRRKRKPTPPPEAINSNGRWHVISSVDGPYPRCHLIDPFTGGHLLAEGSIVTRCDLVGWKLYTPEVGVKVYPCLTCWQRSRASEKS